MVIDIDEISRKLYDDYQTMQKTFEYLQRKYGVTIENGRIFFDMLMSSRKCSETLEDPLYKAIESELDDIIISSKEISVIVLDWALLPKTKYFQMCDYNILLLPVNDAKRKEAVIKRDNLKDTTRLDRRDRYSVDYRNYKFDKTILNQYDGKQFAALKKSILEELETSRSEDAKEREKDFNG